MLSGSMTLPQMSQGRSTDAGVTFSDTTNLSDSVARSESPSVVVYLETSQHNDV